MNSEEIIKIIKCVKSNLNYEMRFDFDEELDEIIELCRGEDVNGLIQN